MRGITQPPESKVSGGDNNRAMVAFREVLSEIEVRIVGIIEDEKPICVARGIGKERNGVFICLLLIANP